MDEERHECGDAEREPERVARTLCRRTDEGVNPRPEDHPNPREGHLPEPEPAGELRYFPRGHLRDGDHFPSGILDIKNDDGCD